jgi:hypothetical protein
VPGNVLTIDPDIGLVVDGTKVEKHTVLWIPLRWHVEGSAVPAAVGLLTHNTCGLLALMPLNPNTAYQTARSPSRKGPAREPRNLWYSEIVLSAVVHDLRARRRHSNTATLH